MSIDEAELRAFLSARLARFKVPQRYCFQTDPLPTGGTGKILKKDLREQFWQGQDKRVKG